MNMPDRKTNNMIWIKELTDHVLEKLKGRNLKWLIVGLNLEQKRQGNINLKNIEGAEREDIQGE